MNTASASLAHGLPKHFAKKGRLDKGGNLDIPKQYTPIHRLLIGQSSPHEEASKAPSADPFMVYSV